MATRNCAVLYALSVVVLPFVSCVCLAQYGQSCIVDSRSVVSTSCSNAFTYGSGDFLPPGSRCLCNGLPEVITTCFKALCSKYVNSCPRRSLSPPATATQPVCLATGNTYIGQQDIRIPGLGNGLTLTRTRNSILRPTLSSVGLFGPNWRSTYEERIYIDDDYTIAYVQEDGNVWNFVSGSGQTFIPVAPANSGASLVYGSTNWTLTFQNGEQRTFDINSGNLLSIIDRNGNTTRLTYDASFRLVTVTDPASRHLYFSYASPSSYLVTSVSSDVGVSLTYSYDGQGRLIQYTKPDKTTVSFQYSDPNPTLITSVLDSNGKVLESHTYDSQARGLTSSRAGGVEAVTITYPSTTQGLP